MLSRRVEVQRLRPRSLMGLRFLVEGLRAELKLITPRREAPRIEKCGL